MEFKQKFIAYIDVLGFKKLVQSAEAGDNATLKQVIEVLRTFGSPEARSTFEHHGPRLCPQSRFVQRNLDFRATNVSDCLVVSSEVSPAGVINLISHCWAVVIELLQIGVMCRGYITRGNIFHEDSNFVGTGYQEAYENESHVTAFRRGADERGTPFVEIDEAVSDYILNCENWCVKEMYSRCVNSDGEAIALFPFQRISHKFLIRGFGREFQADKEKQANQIVRRLLEALKERVLALVDKSNPSAVEKSEHYVRALNAQLAICDKTDEIIDRLKSPLWD
jgi:hypothetical protein